MAYLGNSTRDRTTATARPGAAGPRLGRPGAERIADGPGQGGRGTDTSRRWTLPADGERATSFGAGLALGLTLGAGLALLLTPRTGAEARAVLRRSVRRARSRGGDAWDDLGDALRTATRRGGRRVRRAVQHSGWTAQDLIDERRALRRRKRAARMAALDC